MNAAQAGAIIHAGIRNEFHARGGTPEQWARVAADPRKFNRAWRLVLNLPDGDTLPPPEYRKIDPSTGEIVVIEKTQQEAHTGAKQPAPVHVACIDCEGWLSGCKRGFTPSLPYESIHLCERYTPRVGQ